MSCCSPKKGSKKGFTLIEMLIVIVIIGVLASALVPRLASARGKANDVARKADLQQLATAIISYQIDSGAFPGGTKLQVVTSGTMGTILKKGGMASIPIGDINTTYTGLDNNLATGYMYYPMKKNGGANNGFVIMARAETEGGGNYIICPGGGGTMTTDGTIDIDNITTCSTIAFDATYTCATGGAATNPCRASDRGQIRYIYKY